MKHFFTRLKSYRYGSATDLRKVSLSFTEVGSVNYLTLFLSVSIRNKNHDWIRKVRAWKKFNFFFLLCNFESSFLFWFFFSPHTFIFPSISYCLTIFSSIFISVIIDKKPCISFILKKKKKSFSLKIVEFPKSLGIQKGLPT